MRANGPAGGVSLLACQHVASARSGEEGVADIGAAGRQCGCGWTIPVVPSTRFVHDPGRHVMDGMIVERTSRGRRKRRRVGAGPVCPLLGDAMCC